MTGAGARARALFLIVLLALIPSAPSLTAGFFHDDFQHLAILEGALPGVGPLDLYYLQKAAPGQVGPVQGDYLPWWGEDQHVHYFRPVASATFVIDHAIYGAWAPGYHLTNMLLFALLLVAAERLYRTIERRRDSMRPPTAHGWGFAALTLVAVSHLHAHNVAWLSDRHTVIGALFSVVAIDTWLGEGPRWRRAVGPVIATVLALGSSESALGVLAWFLSAATFLETGPLLARAKRVLPPVATILAYVAFYELAGFGAHWGGRYHNPLRAPGAFLADAFHRIPQLIVALTTPSPAAPDLRSVWDLTPQAYGLVASVQLWLGLAILVLAVAVVARRRAADRFLLVAMLLNLVPLVTTEASGRVILLPSLAAAALIAGGLHALWARGRSLRVVAALVAGVTIVGGVAVNSWTTLSFIDWSLKDGSHFAHMPLPAEAPNARVLLLDAPPGAWTSLPQYRTALGLAPVGGIWQITLGPRPVSVERLGPRTIKLTLSEGLLANGVEEFWATAPIVAGVARKKGVLTVTPGPTIDGVIRELTVELDRPLEDPDVWLLVWERDRYVRVPPPPMVASGSSGPP